MGRYEGSGFLYLGREVMLPSRKLRDPNGFYRLLDVVPWASEREIKKAYRKLSRRYHPDGSMPDPQKFEEVSFAYYILTQKREEYDNLPEGLKWRVRGEDPLEGVELPVETNPEEYTHLGYSYYYEGSEDHQLAHLWYHSLKEYLPRWGYRGRVAIKLGHKLSASGRLFEVPYHPPTPASLFLLGLYSTKKL